jgi:hypothetical protein
VNESRPGPGWRRELWILAAAIAATALATWPLALHLLDAQRLTDKTYDDYIFTWNFWWLREAIVVRGVDPLFCPDIFHPHGASVVVSPLALPLGLLSLPFQAWFGSLEGSVIAVKVFAFLSFPLAVWSMSWLLRALGVPTWAGVLAGLLFAFAPFRLLHLPRIHYLAGALAPLYLGCALRAMRGGGARWIAAAGFVFAWAGAIDPSLLVDLVLASGALWFLEARRRAPVGPTALRLLACGLLGGLFLSPLLVRFVMETRDNEGADVGERLDYVHEPNAIQRILSPDLEGILWCCSPALHGVVGGGPAGRERPMASRTSAEHLELLEHSFHPAGGVRWLEAAAAGAVVALVVAASLRGLRARGGAILLAFALLGLVLALGPRRGVGESAFEMPYAWLAHVVPGMEAGRYPPAHLRLFQLCVAVLAGLGLARARPVLGFAGGGVAVLFFLVAPLRPYSFGPLEIDQAHEIIAADPTPGAVLELPVRWEIVRRRMAMGQVVHRRPMTNGPLTRVADSSWRFFNEEPFVARLARVLPARPAADDPRLRAEIEENLDALRRYDVRWIVVRRTIFEHEPQSIEWSAWYSVGRSSSC